MKRLHTTSLWLVFVLVSQLRVALYLMAQNNLPMQAILSAQTSLLNFHLGLLDFVGTHDVHVLRQTSSRRVSSRQAVLQRVLAVETALKDLKQLEATLMRAVSQLGSLVSPFGLLPNELLREILVNHMGLTNRSYREIDKLGSVCSR